MSRNTLSYLEILLMKLDQHLAWKCWGTPGVNRTLEDTFTLNLWFYYWQYDCCHYDLKRNQWCLLKLLKASP